MIKEILFNFPADTPAARDFFKSLIGLLSEARHETVEDGIALFSGKPQEAYPRVRFCAYENDYPFIRFDPNDQLKHVQELCRPQAPASFDIAKEQDEHGTYFSLRLGAQTFYRLPITELATRLKGHLVRVDHVGFNIPSKKMQRHDWDTLVRGIARECNMYKYPTSDDWPFIIPATEAEFTTDIQAFTAGRDPKFELVYDNFSPVPTIQIDIETDLSRQQVEQLFPAPYGISFPELADYFRTVYVHHEWSGLNIRFDLRFKAENPANDWSTGKWLVQSGGRIVD